MSKSNNHVSLNDSIINYVLCSVHLSIKVLLATYTMLKWGLQGQFFLSNNSCALFSWQGIPLHLQIDTYEDINNPDAEPIHRAFCQIKVFRDKVSTENRDANLWRSEIWTILLLNVAKDQTNAQKSTKVNFIRDVNNNNNNNIY